LSFIDALSNISLENNGLLDWVGAPPIGML
jgi:hypothetical protein